MPLIKAAFLTSMMITIKLTEKQFHHLSQLHESLFLA